MLLAVFLLRGTVTPCADTPSYRSIFRILSDQEFSAIYFYRTNDGAKVDPRDTRIDERPM